jgi:hypothetical protein
VPSDSNFLRAFSDITVAFDIFDNMVPGEFFAGGFFVATSFAGTFFF